MDPRNDQANIQMWNAYELGIPGLNLFGHCSFTKVQPPLFPHDHGKCIELIFLLKGSDNYSVEGKQYHLHGGDVFVSFSGQLHQSSESHQGIGEYIWFQIDPYITNFLGLSAEYAVNLKTALCSFDHHCLKVSSESLRILKELYRAIHEKRNKLYCTGLLVCLLSNLLFNPPLEEDTDNRIENCLNYIEKNIGSTISIDELSRVSGMSVSGFKHRFKQQTGYTPCDYINEQRVTLAGKLLLEGNSIMNTAMNAGFNSSDYFSVTFKKYTGQTPTDFVRISSKSK